MEAYPDAKVILSVRDPEGWYKSVKSTIFEGNRDSISFPINIMAMITGSSKLFDLVTKCYRRKENRLNEGEL